MGMEVEAAGLFGLWASMEYIRMPSGGDDGGRGCEPGRQAGAMKTDTYGTTYSSKLKCAFHGWRVLADGEIALDMPENNCCDMSGAIEIAEVIMPSVWKILTFSGEVPDTAYILLNGKWGAYDLRAVNPEVRLER